METRRRLNDEEFIRLWNKVQTVKEVIAVTGTTRQGAVTRAHHLRKKGLPVENKVATQPREYYQTIGAKGGSKRVTKGFGTNPILASMAGRKGGATSRRGPKKEVTL